MTAVGRRSFLLGAVATAVLAACGDDSSSGSSTAGAPGPGGLSLVRFFADGTQLPGPVRYTFGLADASGAIVTSGLPDTLVGSIVDSGGATVATVSTPRRGEGVPRPYYAMRATLPTAGTYTLRTTMRGKALDAAFTVGPAGSVTIPAAGAALPPFDTPTTAEHRGVEPICTRNPACPFHQVTLREALARGKPVVYLVGTPAHCQTAVCGPVLDLLVDQSATIGDRATIVHAEVYTNDSLDTPAPAVQALGTSFEPILFVTDATGTIVERLDVLWDLGELRDALAKVVR